MLHKFGQKNLAKCSEVSENVKNLLKTHKISKKVLAGRTDRRTDRVTEKAKFGQKNLAKCSEVSENVKNLLKTHKILKKVLAGRTDQTTDRQSD